MKAPKLIAVVLTSLLVLPFAIHLLPDAHDPGAEQGQQGVRSEKSKVMSSPQGYPDLFFEYHREIRASEDGSMEYPPGHRLAEFNKAMAAMKTGSSALNWVERGPGNVGGRTRPILVDPDDPDMHTWWVGAVGGGLWKTINGGLKWEYQSDHLPVMSVTSLAMAAGNPDVIYMGTGEGFGNLDGVDGNGMFRSSDRGESWEHLTSTTNNRDFLHVNRLAVDPTDEDVVVAGTGAGIFRTTDGGATWTETYTGPGRVQDLRAQPGNFDMQIAGVNGQGIFYSTDAGLTWQPASVVWVNGFSRLEVTYSRSDPDIAYAAAWAGSVSDLYRSTDGGMSFAITVESTYQNWMGGQGWYDNTLAVHPFDPNIVYVGGISLWRNMVSGQSTTVAGPSEFDTGGTEAWMGFVNFGASHFGGILSYLDTDAVDVAWMDYTTIEVRFGQGTQKAHRFWVSETAGTNGDGGQGIPFSSYQFGDYADIPFQVWDTDNNRQLMFSFRDQADDGEFNLIEIFTDAGQRDNQSREYMFIHKYDYDAAAPHADIAQDGGLVNGMLYFMWPVLAAGATWDSNNLPNQTLTIEYSVVDGLERTIDRGIDPAGNAHVDHHNLVPVIIDEAAERFWMLNANDGGVAVSTDNAVAFRELDDGFAGYNTSQFYGIAKKPGSPIYMGGTQDNGTWISFGNPNNRRGWREVLGGDGFEAVWHATDPNLVLGTIQFSYVLRSTNGGVSFVGSPGMPYDTQNGQFITTLGSSDAAPDNVYTTKADGVWYTRNFGASWELTPITESWGPTSVGKARVSIADPEVVWAGHGLDSSPDRKLHVSMDSGETFEAVELPSGMARAPETIISGLATHPTEAGTAYALFSRFSYAKVLETKDYGDTWTDLSGYDTTGVSTNGYPEVATYDLVVMPHSTNVIWVGTAIGIFVSRSYGKEWNYAHNGLPAVSVWRMKIRDDELIVGTHGRGVWSLPLSEVQTGTDDIARELPSGFSLEQNYPNPFNPSTTITFSVPHESLVTLTVFDVIGRKVAVLAEQAQYAAGSHQVTWNAGGYASGVYSYRMEADGKLIQTQQMTLIK